MKKSIIVFLSGIVLFASCSKAENKRTSDETISISTISEISSPPTVEELLKKYGLKFFFPDYIPKGCKSDFKALTDEKCYTIERKKEHIWSIETSEGAYLSLIVVKKTKGTSVVSNSSLGDGGYSNAWIWKKEELVPYTLANFKASDFFDRKMDTQYDSYIIYTFEEDGGIIASASDGGDPNAFGGEQPKYEYKLIWDGENWVKNQQKVAQ